MLDISSLKVPPITWPQAFTIVGLAIVLGAVAVFIAYLAYREE